MNNPKAYVVCTYPRNHTVVKLSILMLNTRYEESAVIQKDVVVGSGEKGHLYCSIISDHAYMHLCSKIHSLRPMRDQALVYIIHWLA